MPRDYTMDEASTIQIGYPSQSGQIMAQPVAFLTKRWIGIAEARQL
jgi:hypothetical protein